MRKLSVFILIVFVSISGLIIGCADNSNGGDNNPDYPNPDHGNPVIEEIRGEIVDGGTLTLASGDSATFYGNAGPTVLQQIDLSARDIIPNEFVYCCESKNSRDSIRISGPIPSGVNPDSLYAIWFVPDGDISGVSDNLGNSDGYEFIIPGDAIFYEVRWPLFYESTGRVKSYVDRTIFDVPYYEQYTTDHCWACATAMLLHFYSNADPAYEPKMWSVVAATDHYDGYSVMAMRYYNTYSNYVFDQIDIRPRIEIENFPDALGNFIKASICDSQYVIAFMQGNHMVVVNGWEIGGFYYNDPQGSAGDIYDFKNWDVYVSDQPRRLVGYFDNIHMVVTIPRAISSTHPGPTLSIGNPDLNPYGIHLDPDTNSISLDLRSDMARIVIDDKNDNSGGTYGLHWGKRSVGTTPKPTIRTDWNLHPVVRIYNPSLSSQNLVLTAYLTDKDGNFIYTSSSHNVTVPSRSYVETLVDTIPLNVVSVADTHFLIVHLYDATGTILHDRLKIHVPIDELALPNIGHCAMIYAVWGHYASGSDGYTNLGADCDISYNSATGLFEGSWNETDRAGSIAIKFIEANNKVDSLYFSESIDGRGTYEMVCVNTPYASSSPIGPGPCYYLEGTEVCNHTALLNVDWTAFGWGVMTNYECLTSGFYMSLMDIRFTE
ncbi:hypothetical protein J7L68_03690 [bacterium]|nr:hypothetical protein [bacterium]